MKLMQGTLDKLILRTLLFGPAHGHQIARHIQSSTKDLLQVWHGSLYPALHRLEEKGWVSAKREAGGQRFEARVQILQADGGGKEASGGFGIGLEADDGCHCPGDVAGEKELNVLAEKARESDRERELRFCWWLWTWRLEFRWRLRPRGL